jgi:predicted nucleic acid-binding protein
MKTMTPNNIFIDTSAFYALMDRADQYHEDADHLWNSLIDKDAALYTSNYITVETVALTQHRLGVEAAKLWYRDILSVVEVLWIDQQRHDMAFELWRGLGRRNLSLVDCASFVTMRHFNVETVFGFDKHFAEQGFEILDKRDSQWSR